MRLLSRLLNRESLFRRWLDKRALHPLIVVECFGCKERYAITGCGVAECSVAGEWETISLDVMWPPTCKCEARTKLTFRVKPDPE